MATPASQLDQLLSTTLNKVRAQITDQITKSSPLLAFLDSKGRVRVDGGVKIQVPLLYALNGTVGSYDGYDPINTTPQGGIGHALYEWRQVAGSITISGKEERQNRGEPAIINLLSTKVEQLELSFEDMFSTMLFGTGLGNGGKDFLGLQAIIGDTGTLGGIDSVTETWWKSVVKAAANLTTLAGVKDLNNVFNSIRVNRAAVDLELTFQGAFEAYEALMPDKIRFEKTAMGNLGFESLAHKSADLVLDPYTPGTRWYFINSKFLEFVQHPDAWMTNLGFQRPYNQDARTTLVICQGNLVTSMRRGLGVITAVTI